MFSGAHRRVASSRGTASAYLPTTTAARPQHLLCFPSLDRVARQAIDDRCEHLDGFRGIVGVIVGNAEQQAGLQLDAGS